MRGLHNATTVPRALPCLLYLAFIGWASLQPQASVPQDVSDKLLHLLAYAGAALLWGWAALNHRALLLALPVLIAYGSGLEIAQGFTPDRAPSVADAIANSLGVVVGSGLYQVLQRSVPIRRLLHLPDLHST